MNNVEEHRTDGVHHALADPRYLWLRGSTWVESVSKVAKDLNAMEMVEAGLR